MAGAWDSKSSPTKMTFPSTQAERSPIFRLVSSRLPDQLPRTPREKRAVKTSPLFEPMIGQTG